MAVSLHAEDDDEGWMAEINTTPLVDVMLVLLIIFLLTVPVVSSSLQLKLPTQSAQVQDTSGDYIMVSIDAAGNLSLNDTYAASPQELSSLIEPYAKLAPKPQLHIRADGAAAYNSVAPIIDMAQGFGFAQVSLLTEPSPAAKGTAAQAPAKNQQAGLVR